MADQKENSIVTVKLSGSIDSSNAGETEKNILAQLGGSADEVVLDMEDLRYISSAGLRIILHLRRSHPKLRIINAGSEVYDILEMTGFTEMVTVEKAYRRVSVEGCEVIGEGYNGVVYRLDRDTAVKVYKRADSLSEIAHEREVTRLALILGVPTVISYDVVRVGDGYGSVLELLDARSFAKILAEEPEKTDWCVEEYVRLLRKIHGITVPEGKLPSAKERYIKAVPRVMQVLSEKSAEKLKRLTDEIPETDKLIHGDCHTKNIVLVGGEVLLIDMDTLCTGHPIFEFAQMYNSYVGYSEYDPDIVLKFQGYDLSAAERFWKKSLAGYLGTDDPGKIKEVEDKIRTVAYIRLIDWKRRHCDPDSESDKETLALWIRELEELLERTDTLLFDTGSDPGHGADSLTVPAVIDNLHAVRDFVDAAIAPFGCYGKTRMQMGIAVEEIFVNIASYAYAPGTGDVTVSAEVSGEPPSAAIVFADSGVQYDPLAKEDPDVDLPVDERKIGGLGIFMTKQLMDDMRYEYRDGRNILTLIKHLR